MLHIRRLQNLVADVVAVGHRELLAAAAVSRSLSWSRMKLLITSVIGKPLTDIKIGTTQAPYAEYLHHHSKHD